MIASIALRKPLAFAQLVKPRITLLVICTTLGGLYLSPARLPFAKVLVVLLGTVLIVGGANTLNMYIERESDARMRRTQRRPLPAGVLQPSTALWFGIALGVVAVPLLAVYVNALTAALALVAYLSYVLVYTPMKKRSPAALLVGAVPGAIPPLMGWTAATNRLDLPGALLFAVLFVWQVPHFLAITLYSSEDFARGGIKVLPLVDGEQVTRRRIALFSAALIPLSLALVPLGVAGPAYFVTALVAGIVFFVTSLLGLRRGAGRDWARSLFLVSLAYITALFVVLAVEGRVAR